MDFGQPAPRPVPLSAPAGAHLHRQPRRLEAPIKRPARRIYRGRVLQRPLGLGLHLGMPELGGGLRPLGRVTRRAGKREVAYAVRAAPRLGHEVFDLERYACRTAVGAAALPLLQQILAYLVAG